MPIIYLIEFFIDNNMITKYRPNIRNPTLTRILGVLRRAGVIDGSKTPMPFIIIVNDLFPTCSTVHIRLK